MSRINRTERQERSAREVRGLPGQTPDVDRHVPMFSGRCSHGTRLGGEINQIVLGHARCLLTNKCVFKWANTVCFAKSVTVAHDKKHNWEILHPWNRVAWLMVIRWVCFVIKSSRTATGCCKTVWDSKHAALRFTQYPSQTPWKWCYQTRMASSAVYLYWDHSALSLQSRRKLLSR